MKKQANKKKRSRAGRGERAARSLLTLVVTLGALWGLWNILVPKPAIADNTPPAAPAQERRVDSDPQESDEQTEQQEAAEVVPADPRRKDCWTFLVVGMDKGGGNTDSLMLVTYDAAAQSVSVGSIARDTRVDVERKLKKINAAYAFGKMEGLLEEVSQTFGVPIDYYLRVYVNGFVRLVNAVDGVDVEVPCSMNYDDPYQDLSIHYRKGMQHLNGQQALEVCRFRQNNDGSGYGDEGRQETQRAVLTQVMKKVLANPGKLSEYADIAADTLDTNLTVGNIIWFATKAVSIDMENVHTMSMPCAWTSPYMYLDPDATLEMVNTYFNPYVNPRTADQLAIITR
ncbi:MAG: LCP family protein [Oscillospiraceae bacterium]|nr:LCP family protein [Oscillospiraceae bacterium]